MSIDYAYAMTTLAALCQVFIGLVAIPNPARWGLLSSSRPRASSANASPGAPVVGVDGRGGRGRPASPGRGSGSRGSSAGRRRSRSRSRGERRSRGKGPPARKGTGNMLDADMLRVPVGDCV